MVIVFDLNGTLLDTRALEPQIRKIFGPSYSVTEWFTELIQYAMATTLSGDYREFSEIAIAVLTMAAAARRVKLSKRAIARMREALKRLPAFPDVVPNLRRFRKANIRMAVLSNSSSSALPEQLRQAGLADFFEKAISVEITRRFKPAVEPYRAAATALGVAPHEMLMVAAHPWDLMGAARAGCKTAFLNRPGKSLYPATSAPTYTARDLSALASQILGKQSGLLIPIAGFLTGLAGALYINTRRNTRYCAASASSSEYTGTLNATVFTTPSRWN